MRTPWVMRHITTYIRKRFPMFMMFTIRPIAAARVARQCSRAGLMRRTLTGRFAAARAPMSMMEYDGQRQVRRGGGESRSADIPQPLEGRISRAHNLQRERTFVPLRVKDPVDQTERRCEHFAEYD